MHRIVSGQLRPDVTSGPNYFGQRPIRFSKLWRQGMPDFPTTFAPWISTASRTNGCGIPKTTTSKRDNVKPRLISEGIDIGLPLALEAAQVTTDAPGH